MAGFLFIPQSTLDVWLDAGTVDIAAEGLRIVQEELTLEILPAFRFQSMLEGEDAAGLLNKVKTEEQIKELGAESYGDSVILGEIAYSGVPGFVTVLTGPLASGAVARAPAAAAPAPRATNAGVPAAPALAAAPPAAAPAPEKQKKEEADLLSQFLLDKLT